MAVPTRVSQCMHRGSPSLRVKINGRPQYRKIKNLANVETEKVTWLAELMNGGAKQQKAQKVINKSLREHLDDYIAALIPECKPNSIQPQSSRQRILRIAEAINAKNIDQLDADKIAAAIRGFRKISMKKGPKKPQELLSEESRNHYTAAIIAFVNWLVAHRRLSSSPLATLTKPKVRVRKRPRGYFKAEEVELLIATIEKSQRTRQLLTGYQRSIFYSIAAHTGLRKKEIASLTKQSFCLDHMPPLVIVKSQDTKNSNEAKLPINSLLLSRLIPYLKTVTGELFPGLATKNAGKLVRADCLEVGLPLVDSRGQKRDFHSIRHTFVTHLGRKTKDARLVQKLARHSDIKTTMLYMHTEDEELTAAVELLAK